MPEFSEESLHTSDGIDIMMWYHEGETNKPAILFLHGNSGQISKFASNLQVLARAGYSVLMMEYRSFGNTPGIITEKTVGNDAALAFDWLKAKGHRKIIVYGYSFGTAFASVLTSLRQMDGLILTAPFASLDRLVSEKPVPFARLALKDRYKSAKFLKRYKGPLLIVHGKEDTLIPYHHALIVFDKAASPQKQLKLLDGETHRSVFFDKKNIPFVLEFLKNF